MNSNVELFNSPLQTGSVQGGNRSPIPAAQMMTVAEPSLLGVISRAILNPAFDVVKFDHVLAIQERLEAKQAEQRFDDAMAAAQAEMNTIVANRDNSQTKSKYADLAQVNRAIRPIYTKHGFSLSFDTGEGAPEGWVRILCYVAAKGHRRIYHKDMPADGKGAKGGDVMTKTHAVGSADTYGMRYLLRGIFNLAIGLEEDDDGQAAGGNGSIAEDQAQTIRELIERTKADIVKFCERFKINSIIELRAKDYETAITLLNLKERRLQK